MKKYLFLFVALTTIGLTSYFSLLPLNGNSQADISNRYITSITPAWYTFSIWSLIYLSWIILGVFLIGKKAKHQEPLSFPLAVGLTALWLIPWHYEYIFTSFVLMLVILGLLLHAFFKQKYFRTKQYSLELFLGWILVATIANLHIFLVAYEFYFFPLIFTVLSLIAGTIINLYFLISKRAFIPGFVFIWALFGIILGQDAAITQNISLFCIGFITLLTLVEYRVGLRKFFTGKKK
jgi:translocator protein